MSKFPVVDWIEKQDKSGGISITEKEDLSIEFVHKFK